MILKKYLLLTFITLLISCIYAQTGNNVTAVDEIFGSKGEIYFKFENKEINLEALSKMISIDKVNRHDVFAYANKTEFGKFLKQGIDFELLPKPGELTKEIKMLDNVNVKGILDWDFYPTYPAYVDMMYQFASEYPQLCQVFSIGQSIQGRELLMAKVEERVWRVGGMYSAAIERIVFWLEKSIEVAETNGQKAALEKLVEFYKTGNLQTFDEYNILWLNDTESDVDVINGFIEVYGDALGRKATYESVVQLHDFEGTHRAEIISTNAEWFEMHSPILEEYKKKSISGVSARSINVVVASGDCSPSMPIGINLPNADWIRAEHGSKSVTLANIIDAHTEANKESGIIEEFYWSEYEIELSRKWNKLATQLHVDLHEIIGHGSGRLKEGVAQPHETLKNYASTIEEARADLFALYFAIDPKLVELGLAPSIDVGYAEYNSYITGGLITQLARVEMGKNLEESHMRNRQLIAKWAYEQGFKKNIIEKKRRDGKTFFVINNHDELREIFGKLLHEVQRIKSEGDFRAAKYLIEKYGVKVDRKLHQEALQRWKSLGIPKFSGFINPVLQPIKKNGKILDISMHYPENFSDQMLFYAKNYSFL
jgi:dipeptidyl-peptidase-3